MAKAKTKAKTKTEFKSRDDVIKAIEQRYGPGSIMFSDNRPIVDVKAISTGALSLDIALGVWGIPVGRIVEIFGPEGGGKTTLCLSIAKSCQMDGGSVAYVDAEHALSPIWAENIGVNVSDMMISQPNSGEEALGIVDILASSGQIDLIIVDSVAALTPQVEIDGEISDQTIGAQARLMSRATRKLCSVAAQSGCTVVFVNQVRHKIGTSWGSSETTPGGRALKFYSSVRLDVRRHAAIKVGSDHIGNKVGVRVVKNKVAPPFKMATFNLYFGDGGYPYGIDYASSVLEVATELGVVRKSSSWFYLGDDRLGNGFEAAAKLLRDDSDLCARIVGQIKEVVESERSKGERRINRRTNEDEQPATSENMVDDED